MEKKKTRPTKYTDKILSLTNDYLSNCEDDVEEYHKTRGEKSDTYERIVHPGLPTREGLALFLNVHRDTIHLWSTIHKEFSDTLDILEARQKQMLLLGGLSGDYNPVIAKLVLSSNHGMRERVDQTSDDKVLPTPIIAVTRTINVISGDDSVPKD